MAEIFAVAAAVTGAAGAIKQGQSQAAAAESQANAADYNAKQDLIRAQTVSQQAAADEAQQSRAAALDIGKQVAGSAQSGLVLGTGSSLDLVKASATAAALDTLNIRYGGQMKALGLQEQSTLDTMQATAARRAGRDAITGSYLNAGAAALTAGANYYGGKKPAGNSTPPNWNNGTG